MPDRIEAPTNLKQPKKKVVICDDDMNLCGFLRAKFANLEVRICGEADTGYEALNLIVESKPDIILLDIDMPMGSGLTVLRFIREMDIGAKVVMLTGDNSPDTVNEALKLGANDFLLKSEIILKKREFFYRILDLE